MRYRPLFSSLQNRLIHSGVASLTTQEVAKALRPFIFSIHPDRFWKHPREKNVNEASLKKLNEFLESNRNRNARGNETVTFYMKNLDENSNNNANTNQKALKVVEIKLNSSENVNTTVHKILSTCSLPTDYLTQLGKLPRKSQNHSFGTNNALNEEIIFGNFTRRVNNHFFYGTVWEDHFSDAYEPSSRPQPKTTKLVDWLRDNCESAREKTRASQPFQEDLNKLRKELIQQLNLKDLRWNCDWGASHMRGCLKNLGTLASQYPKDMERIRGKSLVFSRLSGISCDGEIVLNIEDVRNSWLDLIRSVKNANSHVMALKHAESLLSELLNDITIVRPTVKVQLAKHYLEQINRFSRTLAEHVDTHLFPESWPDSLAGYRLTVDSDAGPLMLTNDGSFNIPASCPAKLAIKHIMENMDTARILLDNEQYNRKRCQQIVDECVEVFELRSLEGDENITAEQMIDFGTRLLGQRAWIGQCLVGTNLRVSMYYSVLNDGQLCVPFNFC